MSVLFNSLSLLIKVLEGNGTDKDNLIVMIAFAKEEFSYEEFTALLERAAADGVSLYELANMFAFEMSSGWYSGGSVGEWKSFIFSVISNEKINIKALVDASAKAKDSGTSFFSLLNKAFFLAENNDAAEVCNMVINLVNIVCDNGGSAQDLDWLFNQASMEGVNLETIGNLINDALNSGLDVNIFFGFMKKAINDGASIKDVVFFADAAKSEGMTFKELVNRFTIVEMEISFRTQEIEIIEIGCTSFIGDMNVKDVVDQIRSGVSVKEALDNNSWNCSQKPNLYPKPFPKLQI